MPAIDSLALQPVAGVETTLARPLSFSVPLLDNDEFNLLGAKRRHEVTVTLRILERIHALRAEPNFIEAVKTLAVSYRHMRGFSATRLYAKYLSYVKSGGSWRTAVKGYVSPSKQPEQFQEFVKGLIEQNPRSIETALEKLREEIWPSGAEVPGYGTWLEFFANKYPQLALPARFPRIWPEGWTVRNLRRYGPSRAERQIFQTGIASAHGSLPVLRRDPSKLRPMEWIAIDDLQLDTMSKFSGDHERGLKPQIAYVGGLMAMCVGTRKHLARLFGPMVDREEKQADGSIKIVRSYVKQIDVQALLYTVFRDHGIPQDYDVTIICENRTATITPAMELMLNTLFGGRIRVHRTSLIEHKTLTNGFVEGGGTPWEKGWLESDFHYLHNQLADLKGYKGNNQRLNGPADLADKLAYSAKFLGQGKAKSLNLPPELIAQLDLPFFDEQELGSTFDFVIDRAERRTKHRFLGFDTITDYRWPHPALPAPEGIDAAGPNNFRSLALLAPQQQAMMIPVERKESTLERWERFSAICPRARVSSAALAMFLLSPNKATFRNHAVTFVRDRVGYSYVDDADALAVVQEGTELLAYVDFNTPGAAVICQLDGKRLGVLRMLGNDPRGVDITDTEAMNEARARRAAIVNRVLAKVRARPLHQAANAQLLADRTRNDELVAAYQAETAQLPVADKVGLAMGEHAARAQQQAKAARQAAKPVSAQSAGKGLADLVQGSGTPVAAPVQGDNATPEAEEGASLSDIT